MVEEIAENPTVIYWKFPPTKSKAAVQESNMAKRELIKENRNKKRLGK